MSLAVALSRFLPVNPSYFANHALGAKEKKKDGVGEGKAAFLKVAVRGRAKISRQFF